MIISIPIFEQGTKWHNADLGFLGIPNQCPTTQNVEEQGITLQSGENYTPRSVPSSSISNQHINIVDISLWDKSALHLIYSRTKF